MRNIYERKNIIQLNKKMKIKRKEWKQQKKSNKTEIYSRDYNLQVERGRNSCK